ncbi:MAG: succinylglutamate-semialdehyde dehydrogenase [Puniceicoccaceae bacterium]
MQISIEKINTPGILQSVNPSNGDIVWDGMAATKGDILRAAKNSREAFPGWSGRPLSDRVNFLKKFAGILGNHKEQLAELISREIGKPYWEALTEVSSMIAKVDISIEAHKERSSEFSGGKASTRFRPHGVVVVIGPYNFPGHLPNGHICPALLAGNTVIFKPSELAPATAEFIMKCWKEAGLPFGVLQVIQGGADAARFLTGLPEIRGIFFTGSSHTGRLLNQRFSERPGMILALEMGGNNPLIVDPEYIRIIEGAHQIILHSAFLTTGQRCTCARRLIVIDSTQSPAFIDTLVQKAKNLRVGDPFSEPAPFMGPLASTACLDRVMLAQQDLLDKGAVPLLLAESTDPETAFITPGIMDVTDVKSVNDEEIFGPILQLIRVKSLKDAVSVANSTRFGLAAGILTDSSERYRYAYPRLQAGIINWNMQLTGASSAAPFGGIKDSGNLRPSAYFAADYCSYPVASMEAPECTTREPLPGEE